MMKLKLVFYLLFGYLINACAQEWKTYTWEEAIKASPDTILSLDCSGLKWTEIPRELFRFTKLKRLDISKNRLKTLPDSMNVFTELQIFDCKRNKIDSDMLFICSWLKIEKMLLGRNQFSNVPSCIGFNAQLKIIDLSENPIETLPKEISKCKQLQAIDLRGILFSPTFQQHWTSTLPDIKWYLDAPCNCLD